MCTHTQRIPAQLSQLKGSMENMTMSPEEMGSTLCLSKATSLVLPVVCGLMFFVGIPGNALSLWVFAQKIPSKTATHVYLINLSVSNLLMCTAMPVLAAYFALGDTWASHQLACRLTVGGVTPVVHTNIYIAVLILTWIALSRLAALTQLSHAGRPSTCARILPSAFFRRLRQVRFAQAMCLGIWVFVLTPLVPVIAFYAAIESKAVRNASREACYSVEVEVGGRTSQMTSVVSTVLFFVCFLLVLASYVSVSRHIRRAQRSTVVPDRHRVYVRVFRNIVVIQLVLAVCLLPYNIFKVAFIGLVQHGGSHQPLRPGCHPLSGLVEVKNGLLLLAVLRSVADPITYFLLDKTFHRHVVDMLSLSYSKQSSQTSGSKSGSRAHPTQTVARMEEN